MKKVLKKDRHVLEIFIENSIPSYIKEQSIFDLDLMECYEELFNYSQNLLSGNKNNLCINSFGTGKSFIFNQKYMDILVYLSNINDDIDLKIHCYLSLAALLVLQKYNDDKLN